jgi:N-acylneuraminate cytidylyltransferase
MQNDVQGRQIVAVIPARGGSKSIEMKNLATVGGVSLLERSIRAASTSVQVSRIIVSTDHQEIATAAGSLGAEVVDRPVDLAEDWARSIDAVLHVIETEQLADGAVIVMLQPTSPFTTGSHIDDAVGMLTSGSVVSVTATDHHPYKSCVVVEGTLKPVAGIADLEAPRQMLPVAVRPNGAIYVARAGMLREHRRFFVDPVVPFTMSAAASVDIDTPDDLARANRIAET